MSAFGYEIYMMFALRTLLLCQVKLPKLTFTESKMRLVRQLEESVAGQKVRRQMENEDELLGALKPTLSEHVLGEKHKRKMNALVSMISMLSESKADDKWKRKESILFDKLPLLPGRKADEKWKRKKSILVG